MKNEEKHLYTLDELSDYKVASDDPDVRNWDVRDADNRVIGKVEDLLINKNIKRVVYLDVHVDKTIIDANHDPYGKPENMDIREFVNKNGESHVIVPIGMVDLDTDNKFVRAMGINHRTFAETKRYEPGTDVNRNYEKAVLSSYNRNTPPDSAYEDDEFYERDEFDKEKYRTRL